MENFLGERSRGGSHHDGIPAEHALHVVIEIRQRLRDEGFWNFE